MAATLRTYVGSGLLVAGLLVIGACGDDDDDGIGRSSAGSIAVQYEEFASFDPHFSNNAADFGHHQMVWRGLYSLDGQSKPQPEMADGAPEVSDDGLTYTVTLKEGLTWSDGEPLTAEDFVAGIQRTCNFAVASPYQPLLSNVAGCDAYADPANAGKDPAEVQELHDGLGAEAPDESTVIFHLSNPQPSFHVRLALWMTYPVPTHVVIAPDAEWPAPTDLVFNGPFLVSSFTPGERMVFARNEAYAGGDEARLDEITFRYVADDASANQAFRTGELDIAIADIANLSAVEEEFPQEILSVSAPFTVALHLNMANAVLADQNVRLALARATDRVTLNNVPLEGANTPTTTWMPADIAGIEPDEYNDEVGFDPEAARERLSDAGYPDGEGFPRLTLLTGDNPRNRALGEFLQAQWREHLNISLELEFVEGAVAASRVEEGNFDIATQGWSQDYSDPETWVEQFPSDSPLNTSGCANSKIDELVEEAAFNTDDEERREEYREVNRLISTELCGVIPLFHVTKHYLVSEELGGVRENAGSQDLWLPGDWSAEDWYIIEDE